MCVHILTGSVTINNLVLYRDHDSLLKIVCSTKDAPPTQISWYKDNVLLNVTEDNVSMSTIVTDPRISGYNIYLLVDDVPDNIIGTYSISVGNNLQTTNHTLSPIIGG